MKTNTYPHAHARVLTKKRVAAFLCSSLFLWNFAAAQDSDEVIELSPFSVQAEEGWVATETLAGSRLRSNFKDVATQIEVMTMEFMDDFAVNSVEESLIYSVNVSGPDDHVSGNGEGFGNNQLSNFNQIRGVSGGTLSRNFFPIDMPTDNYNLSRVTIASGPNSILFGTGSPAGVLDVTLNRAQAGRDFGHVEFEWDDWGGKRYVFDYNKSIIEDKLAVRVAWMDDNVQQDTHPNHDKSTRTYGTLMYRPFENTTLSFHAEKTKRDVNRINRFLPYDRATPWYDAGKPAYDNGDGYKGGSQLQGIFTRVTDRPTIVYGQNGYQDPEIFRDSVSVLGPNELPGVWNLNQEPDGWTFDDDSIFPDDVYTWGTADQRRAVDTQYNVFFEQKLMENMYMELAYNTEDYNEHSWNTGVNRNVTVDVNQYSPDGSSNPHYGEFYIQSGTQFQFNNNNRENWRGTISYEFDFAEKSDGWAKNLGRHRMAALRSHDRYQNKGQQGLQYRWLPGVDGDDVVFPGFEDRFSNPNKDNNWATDGTRRLDVRHYLNEETQYRASEIPGLTLDGRAVELVDGSGVTRVLPGLEVPYFDENGNRLVGNNAPQGISNQQYTTQFSYQGYFWNNRIVATYGWRQDSAGSRIFDVDETARNSGKVDGAWRKVYDENGNVLPFARPTGLYPYYNDLDFTVDGISQKGITRTTGLVFHATDMLSFHYNESDTFQPNIGRFDPYGTEYPGAEGDGKDYGVRLELFDKRLTIRYNEFETLGGPQRAANTPFNRWRDPLWNVENRWRNLHVDPAYPGQGVGGFREKGRCCYWVMSDKESEGQEIVIAASPIENLNLRLTWTDRTAVESNIGAIWDQYLNERLAVWKALDVLEGGDNSTTDIFDDEGNVIDTIPGRDMDGDGTIGRWNWDNAWYNDDQDPAEGGDTIQDRYNNETIGGSIGWALIQSLDGKANEFDRTSRWNFNASYRITEGALKGVNYGGAMRWREAPVVGYGLTGDPSDPESVINLSDVQHGAEDFTVDLFAGYRGKLEWLGERNYKVQVNVRNVLDEAGNVPGLKDIYGNNIRMLRKPGRQFIVSFEMDI